MKSFCIVFPIPVRYFGDMVEASVQVAELYQKAAVHPVYVATMKRPYYFENTRGEYCEFEGGDRFLIFYGEPEYFNPRDLFFGAFPDQALLKEIEWEGTEFEVSIVTIDNELEQIFADLQIDINTYSTNNWMLIEDYTAFVSRYRSIQEQSI